MYPKSNDLKWKIINNIYLTPVVQSMIEWAGKTSEANVELCH